MRVAIFSDVHGNLTALEAVLKDIKEQSPDLTLFAGDLCTDGPRPAECLHRVRDENIAAIYGNTDQRLRNQPVLSLDLKGETPPTKREINDNDDWTWAQLATHDQTWLEALPFHRRVSPTLQPNDDLFVVHANPKDTERHIFPSEERQQELLGEVQQPDDDVVLKRVLGDLKSGVLAFGHYHAPSIRYWHEITLANISSVSLPLDGDQRAKYGLFTWNEGWTIEHKFVPYDVDLEIEVLKEVKPPNWENLTTRLQTATA